MKSLLISRLVHTTAWQAADYLTDDIKGDPAVTPEQFKEIHKFAYDVVTVAITRYVAELEHERMMLNPVQPPRNINDN